MHEQYRWTDRTTKLRDSITTLIASNFELVPMKSNFVEGIRIEKIGFDFVQNFEIQVSWGMTHRVHFWCQKKLKMVFLPTSR